MSTRVVHYVPQLLTARAEQAAEACAVVSSDATLTFGELNARAAWLADQLNASGGPTDLRVGLCIERSAAWVVGALATLKAGATYVALDPTDPSERLDYILRDSDVPIVLGSRQTGERLRQSGRPVVLLDQLEWPRAARFTSRSEQAVRGDHLAYVIYTSGSTGRPKGVQITHDALRNLVYWHRDAFQVTPADRASQQASPGFDVSVWELWGNLGAGASVHVTDDATRMSPPALLDWLVEREITISFVSPPIAEYLIDREWPAGTRLRYLLTGGDTLHRAPRRGLPFQVVNNYGPTETTVFATSGVVEPADRRGTPPTIGRAIRGMRAYVVDPDLRPVPRGTAGELCLEGIGLARGYINLPEETASKFVVNPFSDDPRSRLYRTGDRAAVLTDGRLAFLGRLDEQVKIRGHRVEPSEISVTLNSHPSVQASAVVTAGRVPDERRLVAYVVARNGSVLQRRELVAHLAKLLPHHMVPSAFVRLNALPLTRNGKIDRTSLPAATEETILHDRDGQERIEPRTTIERELARLWTRLLDVSTVGVRDNFFELGGDSLTVARLFQKVETRFGIRLPASTLLERGTIESLAEVISGRRGVQERSPVVALRASGSRRPLFLVHGIGAEVVGYQPLVRHLPQDLPVYGLEGEGEELRAGTALRIESMAARYLTAMRDVQPAGPYAIAGYSAGGVIAYEIARQIRADGEDVDVLVMLDGDSAAPARPRDWRPSAMARFTRNLGTWLVDDFLVSSAADLRARVASKARRLRGRLISGTNGSNGHGAVDVRDRFGVHRMPERLVPWLEACGDALDRYRPGRYPGKIVMLRARTWPLLEQTTPDRGWAALADGGVEVRTVRGDHATILREPHVRELAQELSACLESSRSGRFEPVAHR